MSKKEFLCVKTFAADEEQYGVDFVPGNVYVCDIESGYMESTENGTSVWLTNDDLNECFVEFDKELGDAAAQYREYLLGEALSLAMSELNEVGVVGYTLPDELYHVRAYVESYRGDVYYLVEPNRVVDNVYGFDDEPSYEPMGEVRFANYDDFEDLARCFRWCLDKFDAERAQSLENKLENAREKSEFTANNGDVKKDLDREHG